VRRHQGARYQLIFEQYNEQPTPPTPGQDPANYKRSLLRSLRDKLSTFDERRIDSAGT
jgi:hypothetical protein